MDHGEFGALKGIGVAHKFVHLRRTRKAGGLCQPGPPSYLPFSPGASWLGAGWKPGLCRHPLEESGDAGLVGSLHHPSDEALGWGAGRECVCLCCYL